MIDALSCLGEGIGMKELIIRGVANPSANNPSKGAFLFPDLKKLVLHGENLHSLADHISGPLLMSVQLNEHSWD